MTDTTKQVTIDPEFKSLIPPLSAEERAGLRASLEEDGCRDQLTTWNGILLDGHNRFELCAELDIPFYTRDARWVHDRDEAKLWIINNQLARRNLSPFARAELALKKEPLLAAQARERMLAGKADPAPKSAEGNQVLSADPTPTLAQGETRDALAAEANMSHGTFAKAKLIVQSGTEDQKERLRHGETTINAVVKEIMQEETRAQKVDTPAMPDAKYRVLYVDPPWRYSSPQHGKEAQDTVLETHYPTMSDEELLSLPVEGLALDDAVLFCWATSPRITFALELVEAWGFTYKAMFVWDKQAHNVGHYNSVRHELLLLCTRGSCLPDVKHLHDSVYSEERTEHSRKPEYFRKLIDELYPHGKRIELFSRGALPEGWERWGNE